MRSGGVQRDGLWCARARSLRVGDRVRLGSWSPSREAWYGGEVLVVRAAGAVDRGRVALTISPAPRVVGGSLLSYGAEHEMPRDLLADDYVELDSREVVVVGGEVARKQTGGGKKGKKPRQLRLF